MTLLTTGHLCYPLGWSEVRAATSVETLARIPKATAPEVVMRVKG